MDKSKLKVFEIPFTLGITGTLKVLAESMEKAIDHIDNKIEDGSFGVDKDNLADEGLLHDGSMVFGKLEATEPEAGTDKRAYVETTDDPSAHPDWDIFKDDASESAHSEGE